MYDYYKPLRNKIRRLSLAPSLRVVWAWMNYLQFKIPFPADIHIPMDVLVNLGSKNKGIYEWELVFLAKELMIHGPNVGAADLRQWPVFSDLINTVKSFDNNISQCYLTLISENILTEMYRHTHQQFVWQDRTLVRHVTRYFKLFSHPKLDQILMTATGLDSQSFYTIGLSMAGHFLRSPEMETPVTFSLRNITQEQVVGFFERFSIGLTDMRNICIESQSYDEDFLFAFNPLKKYPLLRYERDNRLMVAATIPTFLINRFTEGVYYEVVNADGFNHAFGESFQTYVGEVLTVVNATNSLSIRSESQYSVGRNRKDTVDWLAEDANGALFIECKTKRITQTAKIALRDLAPLEAELDKLSNMIVQVYKTLGDALAGHYEGWQHEGRAILPIIVTLEEWYLFGGALLSAIEERVKAQLEANGLEVSLLAEHPYVVCSIGDFERLMPIVCKRGVSVVMKEIFAPKRKGWLLHGALRDAFQTDFDATWPNLFPRELDRITGA